MSLDGSYSTILFDDGGPLPSYGPTQEVTGGPGHYPWAICLSKHEGRWIGTGLAHFQPVMGRIKQPADPIVDHNLGINFNEASAQSGSQIHYSGSAPGFPREVRPSFWTLRGSTGAGWMTNLSGANTFEDLMATYPTDAALGAYIQAGMGGSVPRPEIVGNALRDYIYAIRRGTMQGSLGPTPYQPGPNQTDTTTPLILTVSAVRNSATQIIVSWTTDRPTIGIAAAGAAGTFALGIYSLFSALENGFGISHNVTVQVLAGVSPVHYTVVVEDQHGNFAHCVDQVVPESSNTIIGGAGGSLVTGYGTWTFGGELSPSPAYGGPPFFRILLNGKWTWSDNPMFGVAQKLTVANGGNIYAFHGDQQWSSYTDYSWQFTTSPDLVPVPFDPTPTTFTPPYTPSPDGTTISGGTGSLVT